MSEQGYWFDASALERSGLDRLRRPGGAAERVAAFAAANGLEVLDEQSVADSLLGRRQDADEVLRTRAAPTVEFGNAGSLLDLGVGDPRHGAIAVRHGLALPPIDVPCRSVMGTKTLTGLASTTMHAGLVVGAVALMVSTLNDDPSDHGDSGSRTKPREKPPKPPKPPKPVDLLTKKKDGFTVTTLDVHAEAAWRLLTPEVVVRLGELARSYTLSIGPEWFVAVSRFGDVVTDDPEIWAWVFSTASRMLDLAQAWRGAWPPADTADPADPADPAETAADQPAPWDLGTVGFYTPAWVPRPTQVEGVLSRASIARLRPGRGKGGEQA